jgi:hypothetical protein
LGLFDPAPLPVIGRAVVDGLGVDVKVEVGVGVKVDVTVSV